MHASCQISERRFGVGRSGSGEISADGAMSRS